MNTCDGLPENGHNECIDSIDSWQFHVICKKVRRYSLKNKLPHIRKFPFISLKRGSKKPNTNSCYEQNYEHNYVPRKKSRIISLLLFYMRKYFSPDFFMFRMLLSFLHSPLYILFVITCARGQIFTGCCPNPFIKYL